MQDMRTPKGWALIGTNDLGYGDMETKEEKQRRMRKFDNLIRNTKSLNEEEMGKQAEVNFKNMTANNVQLLQAYEGKKLKSKELIKKARSLKNNKKSKKDTEVIN